MGRSLTPLACACCTVSLSVLALAGCQRTPAMADATRARLALGTALEAWKHGEPPETLHKQDEAIYCNDDEWAAGFRLRSYTIADGDDFFGRSCRIQAQLELENKRGAVTQKKIVYLIDTESAVVIVRDR